MTNVEPNSSEYSNDNEFLQNRKYTYNHLNPELMNSRMFDWCGTPEKESE